MRCRLFALLSLAIVAIGCQSTDSTPSSTPPPASAPSGATYASIKPILDSKCSGCHGAQPKEGYDVRTYESVLKGGESGPLVRVGDAPGSLLIQVLKAQGKPQMPPAGPIPAEDIAKIEAWIQAGAKS